MKFKLKSFAALRNMTKEELLNYITDLHCVIRDTGEKIKNLALDVKYKK